MSILKSLGKDKYYHHVEKTLVNVGVSRNGDYCNKSEIKLAFLGGSVTTGYMPNGEILKDAFPNKIVSRLEKTFPNKKITPMYLGCSGTRSIMGITTTELLLKDFLPDMVFLDYAINEEISPSGINAFEGLVRKLLNLESHPDVFPVAVFLKDGYSCDEFMTLISKHYNLYMCGLKNGFYKLFQNKTLDWNKYSMDQGHPHEIGHKLISDCVGYMLDKAISEPKENMPIKLPPPITSNTFEDIGLLFPFGFTNKNSSVLTDSPISQKNIKTNFTIQDNPLILFRKVLKCSKNQYLRYEGNFSTCFVIYTIDNSKAYGNVRISVNGRHVETLQGSSIFGWKNPCGKLVFNQKEKGFHKLEITMEDSGRQEEFYFLAIGIG